MTDTHRCLRGRACADAAPDPHAASGRPEDSPRLVPAATVAPHTLCDTCERHAARAIDRIPRVYIQLETIIGQHDSSPEHVSGTREPPIPPRVDVLVLQAELDVTLTTWAYQVAQRLGIDWDHRYTPHLRAGVRVQRTAAILAPNVDALLRIPEALVTGWRVGVGLTRERLRGVDGAMALMVLHRRAQQLISGGTGDARLPVPCPTCEAPALVRLNGADQVDCRACGRVWPESDYRRLCLILADDYARRGA